MRSGFTFVKNGERLGYPYRESILSLAPYVDEIVVAHGDSSDNTLNNLELLARDLTCPLRIIPSPWNPDQTKKGSELARQTNIALDACLHDVCFYLQADEVICESDKDTILRDLIQFEKDESVDALVFQWKHFFYTYNYTVHSKNWYRREIRAIKKSRRLKSYGDAQGFRIFNGDNKWTKPRAALSKGRIFHYGWVRPIQVMAEKTFQLDKLWHGDKAAKPEENAVFRPQYGIETFKEKHPTVMQKRIDEHNQLQPKSEQPRNKSLSLKWLRLFASDLIEKITDHRIGEFKNYKIVKKY